MSSTSLPPKPRHFRLNEGHCKVALNMVRMIQQNFSADVSIGLLRDRIGRHPWILAAALPWRDFAFALG